VLGLVVVTDSLVLLGREVAYGRFRLSRLTPLAM